MPSSPKVLKNIKSNVELFLEQAEGISKLVQYIFCFSLAVFDRVLLERLYTNIVQWIVMAFIWAMSINLRALWDLLEMVDILLSNLSPVGIWTPEWDWFPLFCVLKKNFFFSSCLLPSTASNPNTHNSSNPHSATSTEPINTKANWDSQLGGAQWPWGAWAVCQDFQTKTD